MPASEDAARKGLLKLMLRLPAMRHDLQKLWPSHSSIRALCEAYEDATAMRDRLASNGITINDALMWEYQTICDELESEITEFCLSRRR